jgi:hypothetical protein
MARARRWHRADAAGKGGLADAVELAGGPSRVITLADEHAADFGVSLSAPTPDRAPGAVDESERGDGHCDVVAEPLRSGRYDRSVGGVGGRRSRAAVLKGVGPPRR